MVRALVAHPTDPLLVLVPLARGRGVAVIDAIDAVAVAKYNWHLLSNGGSNYAKSGNGTVGYILLHRMISELAHIRVPAGSVIDHVNRNGLDCRRINLRPATKSQNQFNRGDDIRNKSGVKGVSWNRQHRKWIAYACVNYKKHFLGLFEDIDEAAAAVGVARRKLHGDFANNGTVHERN